MPHTTKEANSVNTDIYRFEVGKFDCAIVNDGFYAYPHPGETFFENAPHDELAAALKRHGIDLDTWTEYVSPYPSLVVNTGLRLVLVDTGMGPRVPTTGKLHDNLRSTGFPPEDFDVVVITHVHPDHVGGNVDSDGRPAFPNARYVLWQREWDFWTGEPDLSGLRDDFWGPVMLHTAEQFLPPIEGLVDFVEPDAEIVPGITAVAAPGHTPGQLALIVASEGEQLMAVADAVAHPIHLEQPGWLISTDLLVDETVDTRHRLLGQATAEKMQVFAPHFIFPSLGYVEADGSGWAWLPSAVGQET
jgi:glyoxylase-like metal-dependent hydrolase (beta-lactamase superfamily II)